MELPNEFILRMKERLGEEFPAFLRAYERPPYKGLRVNTLKIGVGEFCDIAPFPLGEQLLDWDICGFCHAEEKAGADVLHFAGLYYCQEPSAMAVGGYTDGCKKERVLDLCAAPGGKTTQIAAQMEGDGILISNEIDYSRAKALSQNVERMGIRNCAVTSASPAQLAEAFPAYFDLIVTDAPCSGEGMFKKEPSALRHWSIQNVKLCAARQREILDCAAKMLAGGGRLVYSTCTFSREEDEGQIAEFLARHPEFGLEEQQLLLPHAVKGEGHFVALLKKSGEERGNCKPYAVRRSAQANQAFLRFARETLTKIPCGEITTLSDGRMYLVPEGLPALNVRVLRLGVELGEYDGKHFKPAHALAMALRREEIARYVPLSRAEAERYLKGETLPIDSSDGWYAVGVGEYPLGWGKAVGGTLKNHYPKGLRKLT